MRAASPNSLRNLAAAALATALLALSACTKDAAPAPDDDDGWTPDPQPMVTDFTLVVTPAAPKVVLGGDLAFKVRVENHGQIAATVNIPRLGRDSVTFTVRGGPFDVARLDPIPVREDPRGAMQDPPATQSIGPGESAEGEIRITAVQTGTLVFTPVYVCQALDGPLTCAPVTVEVTPSPEGAHLGVRLQTTQGTMDMKLRGDLAFQTATAWATLVKKGFYDGTRFHRVMKGFMAQGGDPKGQGWGGPGYMLRRELHGKLPHRRGVFSMARQARPDTAGSQFFIMFHDAPQLDEAGYTTFGELVAGEETLARIESIASEVPDDPSAPGGVDQSPKEPVIIQKASLILLP